MTAFLGIGDHFGSFASMLGTTRQNFNAENGQAMSGMDGQSNAVGEPRLWVCITLGCHKTEQHALTQKGGCCYSKILRGKPVPKTAKVRGPSA